MTTAQARLSRRRDRPPATNVRCIVSSQPQLSTGTQERVLGRMQANVVSRSEKCIGGCREQEVVTCFQEDVNVRQQRHVLSGVHSDLLVR